MPPLTEAQAAAATEYLEALLDGCHNSNSGAEAAAWLIFQRAKPSVAAELMLALKVMS